MIVNTVSRKPKNKARVKATSAVAAVAYALTTSLTDERLGETFNCSHGNKEKALDTIDLGLIFPGGKHIYQKEKDRQGVYAKFWSKVELAEKRKDARTARTIIVALPVEMDLPEHQTVVEKFQKYLADSYGIASQAAIHYDHLHNPHAHIVTTTRTVTSEGELGEKIRILDSAKTAHFEIKKIGEAWAKINNDILIAKYDTSITHKNFEEQGIDKPRGEHLGPAKWRTRQKNLTEEEQEQQERKIDAVIQQRNKARRRSTYGISDSSEEQIFEGYRNANSTEEPGAISGHNSRKRGSGSHESLDRHTTQRENGSSTRTMGTGSAIDDTSGKAGNGDQKIEEITSCIPGENRDNPRENARQVGSDYGRRESGTQSSITGDSESDKRIEQQIDSTGNFRELKIISLLEKIDLSLTRLANYFAIRQVKNRISSDIFAKLDKAFNKLQEKINLDFIKGERHGNQSEDKRRNDQQQRESGKQKI